jgi:hypothetical protein
MNKPFYGRMNAMRSFFFSTGDGEGDENKEMSYQHSSLIEHRHGHGEQGSNCSRPDSYSDVILVIENHEQKARGHPPRLKPPSFLVLSLLQSIHSL